MTSQYAVIEFDQVDSFCAYSLPGSLEHSLVYSHRKTSITGNGTGPGIVFNSFDPVEEDVEFIEPDHVVKNGVFKFEPSGICPLTSTSFEDYEDKVNRALGEIEKGILEKVVLSRMLVTVNSTDDLYDYFINLKSLYPTAFVFLYHTPNRGCWCGATPEVIIRKEGDSFMTMALAGTQRNQGLPLDLVEWTEKEYLEQGLIEVFVEDKLSGEKINFEKTSVETFEAGQVLHLCSKYYVQDNIDAGLLVDCLHPGPAICGFPQKESMRFIRTFEGYPRMDYCGYIGLRNLSGHTDYYVNLRSMRIYQDKNVLFVGGGITFQSNAKDEWEETTMKSHTLLSSISNPVVKE